VDSRPLAGVVLLGTLQGILVAIVGSLMALAWQVSDPPVHELARKRDTNAIRPLSDEHPDDESFPGMLLLRLEGRMFFANADNIAAKIRARVEASKPEVVVLDLGAVFDIEYTALSMLIDAEKRMRAAGVPLWLAGLNLGVLAMVQRSTSAPVKVTAMSTPNTISDTPSMGSSTEIRLGDSL
jgi:sulfate permease, SulP family